MSKVELLICDTCGEARMSVKGTRCIMTLGCPGVMVKHITDQLSGQIGRVKWNQLQLFETVDAYRYE
jgi:hypothetical protein